MQAVARKANFAALQQPVQQFFNAIEKGVAAMSPSIYVKASTQFQSLILTMAATKIHQVRPHTSRPNLNTPANNGALVFCSFILLTMDCILLVAYVLSIF